MNDWFKDEAEYERHREMLSEPRLWPMPGEMLMVKHPVRMREGREDAFGRIYRDAPLVVVEYAAHDEEKYSSVEEMLEAGWVVD